MSVMVGGTGIIGQDMVCGFGNGKYKTFEGTEISIKNCLKAKVKDLVVEGKTIQDTEDLSNIESVAEREENLVNIATVYESMLESGTIGSLFNPKSNSAYDVYKMEIQPNTEYLFNLVGYGQTPWVRILDKNNITVKAQNLPSTGLNYIWSLKTESNFYYLVFNKPKTATGEFKIYKEQNPYPLKLKINEENNYINLPIPLRSLPNGVADTIEGNKLVQRVGKIVLDGSADENWIYHSGLSNDVVSLFYMGFHSVSSERLLGISDRLPCYTITDRVSNISKGIECFYLGDGTSSLIQLQILNSRLATLGKNGLLTYLQANPITIYYPLAEPIIHPITIPPLATAKGTNIITTENNIKPNLNLKVKVK